MSLIGTPLEQDVLKAWEESMKDILNTSTIPEANKYQCGTYKMHSLEDAKAIAKQVLDRGIGVMKNDELTLDESILKGL
jgi:S-ribosylhomocysteine lyase